MVKHKWWLCPLKIGYNIDLGYIFIEEQLHPIRVDIKLNVFKKEHNKRGFKDCKYINNQNIY